MLRMILVAAAISAAQDATPIVYSQMAGDWSKSSAEFSKQKAEINAYYSNRGMGCSGTNASAQNDALVKIVNSFYDASLVFVNGLATERRPINKDSVSARAVYYKEAAQGLIVRSLCGAPISDRGSEASIAGAAGSMIQKLSIIIPPELSRPDLIVDSIQAFFSASKDSLYVYFIVANIGSAAIESTYISFLGPGSKRDSIGCMPLKQSEYASFYHGIKIVGDTTSVIVLADAGLNENEVDEKNNSGQESFLTPRPTRVSRLSAVGHVRTATKGRIDILGRRFSASRTANPLR